MTPQELLDLVSEMTDGERDKILSLLEISLVHPKARDVIKDCAARELGLHDTLAEVSRRLVAH